MNPITLPIPTSIPLDVLCAEPIVFLQLGDRMGEKPHVRSRIANMMQFYATQMWELLIQTEEDVGLWKSLGKDSVDLLVRLLARHGYRLDAFPELRGRLCIATSSSDTSAAIRRVQNGYSMPDVLRRLEASGLHYKMTVDELFVYVPAERTPLTDAQVEYLRRPLEGAFPKSTRMNMWLGYTTCVTVFDLAVLIVHMQDDDTHTVRAFRTELEHVLGPLPMQLSDADLGRVQSPRHHDHDHRHVFEAT